MYKEHFFNQLSSVIVTRINIYLNLQFYTRLVFYKLAAFFEVKNFRYKLLKSELQFGLRKVFSDWAKYDINKLKVHFKTTRGDFVIRDNPADFIIASPSFERQDIDYLIYLMEKAVYQKKKIAFIDIGADFGKYLVTVGMRINKVKILGFEPEPDSQALLKENVKRNNLSNVSIFPIALSSRKGVKKFYIEPELHMLMSFGTSDESIRVHTDILDNYIQLISGFDEVFIKLDVEGHEVEVLRGASRFIEHFKKITLLCEDSGVIKQDELTSYLKKNFKFLSKKTSYNSFWTKENN